jgi:hypothetical protein
MMVHPLKSLLLARHAKPHSVQSTEQVLPTVMIRSMVVVLTRYIQWFRVQNKSYQLR